MNIFLIILVVILSLVVGWFAGTAIMDRRLQKKVAEYEQVIAEHGQKQSVFTASIRDELLNVRSGIIKAASAYEDVVNLVEKELNVKEDLHIIPILPGNHLLTITPKTPLEKLPPIYEDTKEDTKKDAADVTEPTPEQQPTDNSSEPEKDPISN